MISSSKKHIGRAFKKARKKLKLTCYDLAPYMGVDRWEIAKYSIGVKKIPEEILIKLFMGGIFLYVWGEEFKDCLDEKMKRK